MYMMDNYEKIIEIICSMKGIDKKDLFKILEDKELKCLLFLLLKEHKCDDIDKISKDFPKTNKRIINYNIKKAKEKFFINRGFRETYFMIEKKLQEKI